MTKFEVDTSYKSEEYETATYEALDVEEAEQLAMEYIRNTYPEAIDIEVDAVRQVA